MHRPNVNKKGLKRLPDTKDSKKPKLAKKHAKRRAKNKVAKQSRKANRGY